MNGPQAGRLNNSLTVTVTVLTEASRLTKTVAREEMVARLAERLEARGDSRRRQQLDDVKTNAIVTISR